jgi:hypothetical protein
VDFDALHAALGAPTHLDDLTPTPLPVAKTGPQHVGESQGRSSATYSSTRPHTIPPTRAPSEDPDMPAVIVHADDTVPTAPPVMTAPFASPPPVAPGGLPHPGAGLLAFTPGDPRAHGSGPHVAAAVAPSPSYPFTPPPFPVQHVAAMPHETVRMPERPRRARTPTVVVRPRGPTTKQKLLAFIVMFLLVTAGGIGVIVWQRPQWVGLDRAGALPNAAPPSVVLTATPVAVPSSVAAPTTNATASASPSASASANASAAPSVSAKPKPKPAPPPPATHAPPRDTAR